MYLYGLGALSPAMGRARSFLLPVGLVLILLSLAACQTDLVNLRRQRASHILGAYRARPLAAVNQGRTTLTLHDCRRIALANSLDLQAAAWQERVKAEQAKGSLVRMLPKIEGNFDMSQIDRPAFSRSDVIGQEGLYEVVGPAPGTGVTRFSTGRERFSRTWRVELKWSPMDAAMARYLAEAKADDALSTKYQRVRVAQQLIGAVTAAFYRLRALEQALPRAQALERNWAGVVRDLGYLAERGLVERRELLAARDELALARQVLGDTYADMGKQREILAAAMNVCPDSRFTVVGDLWPLPRLCLDSCKLEAAALVNRPEAYQADLSHLISVADHRRALVKLFPRVEGYIGHRRDENKFLLNNDWVEGGVRATWDLMEFAANLLEKRAAEDKMLQTEREAAAISMGIISQVRLKTLDATKAMEELKKFEQLLAQAREQLRIAREVETTKDRGAPGGTVMRIDRQKAKCKVLKAEIDRLLAVGEVHAALAALDAAAGLNYSVNTIQPPPPGPHPVRAVLTGSARLLSGAARIVESLKPW